MCGAAGIGGDEPFLLFGREHTNPWPDSERMNRRVCSYEAVEWIKLNGDRWRATSMTMRARPWL